MTRLLLCLAVTSSCAVPLAGAAQYWVDYEASSGQFPEQQGWERVWGYAQAQRYFENGAFVVDSRASTGIYDYQRMVRPGAIDPGPGETFVMEWRLKIDQVIGPWDLAVAAYADSKWAVLFALNEAGIQSVFEPGVTASFSPGGFHTFRFVSSDMRAYELSIDGERAIQGSFWLSLFSSEVDWGDGVQGGASFARWEYFRFGVVPEPGAVSLFMSVALCLSAKRR